MIVNLCVTASVTKADWITLCASLGIESFFSQGLSIARYPGKVLPVAPVYLASISEFNKNLRKLQEAERKYVLVLGMKHLHVNDADGNELAVQDLGDLSDVENFKNLIRASVENEPVTGDLRISMSEESVGLAHTAMGNSVMHKVQTNLYRIPKGIRTDVQKAVFSYLSGSTPQLGKASQYPHILTMLASEEMQNLRRACKALQTLSIKEVVVKFSVDAFDMNFLLAQSKKSEPQLKTRTPRVVRK